MRGDDVKMLQTVLWYLGFSERDTPGAGGTAVKITGTFSKYPHSYVDDGATITMDAGTYQGVVRLQTRDQVDVNGKVDENTLGKIKKHWGDYVKAFNAFSSSPIVSKEHNSFNNWISAGASELKKTYTNEIRDEVDENLTRDKILKAWVEQETGNKGHWGYKVPYRITLGSGDDLGSIGFSQIQNKYKYGGSDKTVKLDNLNLYNPKDGVIGFARWSNEKDMGEGFYRAFVKNSYDVTQVCKNSDGTKKYPYISKKDNSMLTTCYSGDNKDKLRKGVFAYNGGAFKSGLNSLTWPELLKKYPEDVVDTHKYRDAIHYSLKILSVRTVLSYRSWEWTDKIGNTEFTFTYSESDWYTGTTWQEARDAAATANGLTP